MIGYEGDLPIGQVRFVRDDTGTAEISISVTPDARGRGIGRRMLRAAMGAMKVDAGFDVDRFRARVRPENARSIAMFESLGFVIAGRSEVSRGPSVELELAT